MADRYPLVYNPSANQLQELQSGDSLDAGGTLVKNAVGYSTAGGTSSQFLKADGSTDSNTYLTSAGTIALAQGLTGSPSINVSAVSGTTGTFSGAVSGTNGTFSGNVSAVNVSASSSVTAATFYGNGAQLTGIDASALKDGSDVKVQATATGATITGDISATNATFSGNLTVQGTTTTIDTAVTAVDSLAVEGNVGIGTTNPQVQLHLTSADPYIRLQDTAAPTGYSQIMGTHQGAIAFSADTSNSVADSHLRFDVDGTERLRISSNGALCIGSGYKSTGGGQLTIRGLGVNSYSVQDYQYVGTPSDGNTLAQVRFTANTSGTNVIGGARIQAAADADWSATGDAPTRLQFFTCADASASQTERLRITSGGHILPGADNTQDLGSSSKRFANIYTGDLNLSNEGSANDVDGTWGQYTIQEGEDDLFLINRRTGKKYKFNLTEVN